MDLVDSFEGEFLHLRGLLGKGIDIGLASKKRVDIDK